MPVVIPQTNDCIGIFLGSRLISGQWDEEDFLIYPPGYNVREPFGERKQ